jgi:hypothetical protein
MSFNRVNLFLKAYFRPSDNDRAPREEGPATGIRICLRLQPVFQYREN